MTANQLLNNATIHTIVPCEPEIDFESVLTQHPSPLQESQTLPLSNIQQRGLLFFDELAPVYIILQLVDCPDVDLKSQLSNVTLTLDVFASNASSSEISPETHAAITEELIFSSSVQDTDDPLVIVQALSGKNESTHTHIYIIWKSQAYLHRPRTRFQHPHVVFTAAAAFGSLTSARQNPRDEYIPSLTPASVNVFQPSVDSFSPTSAKPYLPASRLLRVTPAAKTDERIHNLSQSSLRYIRIVPVANSRIRYSRLNTYSTRSVVLATLNFEVTPFTNFEVKLEAIELFVQGGAAENLGSSTGCELPVLCHARDDVAFVFRIAPDDGSLSSETALVRMLEVSIRATVLLSESYQPGISMQWATNVDFSLPLNSTFGGPSQVLQRNSRPTSFPMKPKDLISVEPPRHLYRKALSFKDLGVAVTLSAPACAEVGKQFDWDILIVNRSDKVRKFAMIVTPNNDEPPQKSTRQQMLALPESAVAHAVVDGHISFPATQNLAASNETTLLCLNPDIRVGPLVPGACHSFRLPMLPLSPGRLQIAAIKFLDLDSGEDMEIRDLPDIVTALPGLQDVK